MQALTLLIAMPVEAVVVLCVLANAQSNLFSHENLSAAGLHAVGGFLGGLVGVMRRSRTPSATPGWDAVRKLVMAIVMPVLVGGAIVENVSSVDWTFNTRLTLCGTLGLTAWFIVGWVLNACEKNEGRSFLEVLKDLNLLKWFAAKMNALAGVQVPHEAEPPGQVKPTDEKTELMP